MKVWGRRAEVVAPVSRDDLLGRGQAIREALDAGGEHMPAQTVQRVRAVETKISERTSIAGSRTVAALAGATGSGKSSLFNFLVGEPVSRIGARRPTTSRATAAVWGDEPSAGLLDWLQVAGRHQVTADDERDARLDGLVLLDLPDFDSRVLAHREEADRVLDLVDVFVWVTDPQKYADAVLHDEYVRRLAAHATVTLAVLNQVDRLRPDEAEACVEDLQRLLARDGVENARVVPTSAVTRQGLDELCGELAEIVQSRNAAEQRLLGDLREQARELGAYVGAEESRLDASAEPDLVQAMADAAGVPVVLRAVERDYVMRATQATGWPFTRWTTGLRARPLARLGLGSVLRDDDAKGLNRSDARVLLGRSSIPQASPAARAEVQVTTRRLGQRAAQGLPPSWAAQVQDAATPDDDSIVDALDQAVTRTPLSPRTPAWWTVAGVVQWLLAATAVAGVLWLVALMVLGWLQIDLSAPTWGILPVPLLMLVGGLLAGLALAGLTRAVARRAAERERRRVSRELGVQIAEVAQGHVVEPVNAVLDRHLVTRQALEVAGR